jgi:toxin ParE1/3/4
MKYKVRWTKSAEADLNEIIEYIAKDSINIALEKLYGIRETVNKLSIHPHRCRVVPELKEHNITKYREAPYPPWRIFFRIDRDMIYVLAVTDGRRNIEDILLQRQLR